MQKSNNINSDIIDTENLVLDKINNDYYKYIRIGSKISVDLSKKISECYGGYPSVIVPSGINAISTCLLTVLDKHKDKNINIIYSSEMYCETSSTILWLSNQYKCTHKIFDIIEHEKILLDYTKKISLKKSDKPDVNILFTESCSNPNGYMFNYSIIPELKKFGFEWIIIVDNTWLTHLIQNPFEQSEHIDYVVTSLTKYYSAGNAIGGAIISKLNDNYENIYKCTKIFGLHVSPVNCDIIYNNLMSIEFRIKKSSDNTIYILDELKKNTNIEIYHPYLNKKLDNLDKLKIFPSVFTIKLKNVDKNIFSKIITKSKIDYKTSFGYKNSRIDYFPKQYANGDLLFRVSIGYLDEPINILSELNKIISDSIGKC